MAKLPSASSVLEQFGDWVLATETARNAFRIASDYADIESFYVAAVARAEEAITYLEEIGLEKLQGPDLNLLNLLLSLAEVTPAVAYYGAPQVRGGFDSSRMVPRDI